MNVLLESIKTTLLASLTLSYLEEQVFITPETESDVLFPMSYRPPCVVISDGGEVISYRPSNCEIREMTVRLSMFQYLREPVKALVGDADIKGVINITSDVLGVLKHNLMSLAGYSQAEPRRISKSDFMEINDDVLIRQVLEIEYFRRI